MIGDNDNQKEAIFDTLEFIKKMSYQYDSLTIATHLVITGLGLYRSCLTPEDYEQMCEKIYTERLRIRKIYENL